jgi:hypothetical protein
VAVAIEKLSLASGLSAGEQVAPNSLPRLMEINMKYKYRIVHLDPRDRNRNRTHYELGGQDGAAYGLRQCGPSNARYSLYAARTVLRVASEKNLELGLGYGYELVNG